MGESAGGYLTCMVALAEDPVFDVGENLDYSSSVQAACPWYPPTDFRGFMYDSPEQCAASPESLLLGKNTLRYPEDALKNFSISSHTSFWKKCASAWSASFIDSKDTSQPLSSSFK